MEAAELRRRAIQRAMSRGGAAAVREGRYAGVFHVASNTRSDRQHTVTVEGDTYRCDCESGLAHRPCWAQAAAYLYLVEQGGARVVGPKVEDRRERLGGAPAHQGAQGATTGGPLRPAPLPRRPRAEVSL